MSRMKLESPKKDKLLSITTTTSMENLVASLKSLEEMDLRYLHKCIETEISERNKSIVVEGMLPSLYDDDGKKRDDWKTATERWGLAILITSSSHDETFEETRLKAKVLESWLKSHFKYRDVDRYLYIHGNQTEHQVDKHFKKIRKNYSFGGVSIMWCELGEIDDIDTLEERYCEIEKQHREQCAQCIPWKSRSGYSSPHFMIQFDEIKWILGLEKSLTRQ